MNYKSKQERQNKQAAILFLVIVIVMYIVGIPIWKEDKARIEAITQVEQGEVIKGWRSQVEPNDNLRYLDFQP